MKLLDIYNSVEFLKILCKFNLSAHNAYYLHKLLHEIESEIKIIEDFKTNLLKKYGTEKENGNIELLPATEEYKKFTVEFLEFLQQPVELKQLSSSKLTLEDIEGNNCSVELLQTLDWLII